MRKTILTGLVMALFFNSLLSQVYTNKEVGKKNEALIDSLESSEYPYILPIWGKKATAKGFNLPYSAGFGINYMASKMDLVIENLSVGFNYGPQYDLSELIRFNNAEASLQGITVRPDIWLFPFLNIYSILGKGKTSTSIDAGLWLPDTAGNWNEIANFSTKANFDATTFGLGITPTIGVGDGWLALDMNMTWNDISALEKPAFAFVFGPRMGKTFKFKKKDMNLAVWAGGFRLHIKSGTSGSLDLTELFPVDELQTKIDGAIIRVDEAQSNVDEWWNGLSDIDQQRPSNIAKYNKANELLARTGDLLNDMNGALSDDQHTTVQYSLAKRPKDMWNFLLGTQFQLNKHWMVRAEYGFLSSRQQFLTSLQYRFGL